jgi:hypothetical protein
MSVHRRSQPPSSRPEPSRRIHMCLERGEAEGPVHVVSAGMNRSLDYASLKAHVNVPTRDDGKWLKCECPGTHGSAVAASAFDRHSSAALDPSPGPSGRPIGGVQ